MNAGVMETVRVAVVSDVGGVVVCGGFVSGSLPAD